MVFNHLQKSLKTYVPLSSSRRNSGVWGVTSGERVWHEQAVWTNVWKEPQDSSGCLGTVASAEKGFEWPWDAWARFDEHDFFLDSSLSSRWPWANYVFHHRQGGLQLCLLLFQKQNMPWAPKTYMFIEVFMGTYITWFFRWPSIQTAIFSMGFSSHLLWNSASRKFGGPLWDFFTSALDSIEPAPLVNIVPGWATAESRQKFSSSYTASWIFFKRKP